VKLKEFWVKIDYKASLKGTLAGHLVKMGELQKRWQ
jgi:hypothetical protein